MKKTILFAASIAALILAAVACDDDDHDHDHSKDDPHGSQHPSCRAITEACHYLDVGDGPIHECHELGHDAKSDEPCAARKDECLRICTPQDAASTD